MHTDWNGNGRHDMADDYVDDMLSSGSGPARPAHRGGSGRRLMPTCCWSPLLRALFPAICPSTP